MKQFLPLAYAVPFVLAATCAPAWSLDAEAAQALVKKSDCLKCHAVDKKKDGPSFKETAAKYKGKPKEEFDKILLANIRSTPVRLAVIHRTLYPKATLEQFSAFLKDNLPSQNEVSDERAAKPRRAAGDEHAHAAQAVRCKGSIVHDVDLRIADVSIIGMPNRCQNGAVHRADG